ncbi:hypothetical protein H8E06_00310 [bacterium]|nr:hypothetical protein [bacterium]
MSTEDKYYEAVKAIAEDMADTIDIDNEQAVDEYLALHNSLIMSEVEEVATQ